MKIFANIIKKHDYVCKNFHLIAFAGDGRGRNIKIKLDLLNKLILFLLGFHPKPRQAQVQGRMLL
jgi:hypothetical protein